MDSLSPAAGKFETHSIKAYNMISILANKLIKRFSEKNKNRLEIM